MDNIEYVAETLEQDRILAEISDFDEDITEWFGGDDDDYIYG